MRLRRTAEPTFLVTASPSRHGSHSLGSTNAMKRLDSKRLPRS